MNFGERIVSIPITKRYKNVSVGKRVDNPVEFIFPFFLFIELKSFDSIIRENGDVLIDQFIHFHSR